MKFNFILLLFAVLVSACVSAPAEEQTEKFSVEEKPNETANSTKTFVESIKTETAEEKSCGPLFDTHVHLQGTGRGDDVDPAEIAGSLAQRMAENGIGCALVFNGIIVEDGIPRAIRRYADAIEPYQGKFVPFFELESDADEVSEITVDRIKTVFDNNRVQFKGYGETTFYDEPWRGYSLSSEPWPQIFRFASEKGIVVMVHPREGQTQDLSNVLSKYPNAKVMIHGSELLDDVPELLKTNKNLYFTLDTSVLLTDDAKHNYLYDSDSKSEFIRGYDRNKNALLQNALNKYASIVAAAPERVMWGTDAAAEWHFDKEVYSRYVDFSSSFIAQLPAEQQKLYAYENAVRLLGVPL